MGATEQGITTHPPCDPHRLGEEDVTTFHAVYSLSSPNTRQLHGNRTVLFTAVATEPTPRLAPAGEKTSHQPFTTDEEGRLRVAGVGSSLPRAVGPSETSARPPARTSAAPSARARVQVPRPRRLTRVPVQFSSSRGHKCAPRALHARPWGPSPLGVSRTLLPERRRHSLTGEWFPARRNKPCSYWPS